VRGEAACLELLSTGRIGRLIYNSRWRRIGDLNPGGCLHPTALAVRFFALRARPRLFAIAPERRSRRLSRAALYRD